MNTQPKWLIVDLDDSLIKTDLFIEVLLRCLLTRPHLLIQALLIGGLSIPTLKAFLAEKMPLDASKLPYNKAVLQKITKARKNGMKIMLATAAAGKHAKAAAEHLNLFDLVISSTSTRNLKGKEKLNKVRELIKEESYEYVGDSSSDLILFKEASKCYLVNPSKKLRKNCQDQNLDCEVIDQTRKNLWELDSKILRPYQWMKNIVFFLPAVTSLGLYDYNNLWLVLPAFSIMSMLASVVYIFNDIADVESDRAHAQKRSRGFASGEVSLKFGFLMGLTLLILSMMALIIWRPSTIGYFLAYFSLTIAYTMFLKEVAILDIFVLVSFYLLRILIAIETLEAYYSLWFITFCVFLFANLAFLKRYTEVNDPKYQSNSRRKYDKRDCEFLRTCGVSSVFASIVLLMLYSKSPEFSTFYKNKDLFSMTFLPYSLLMLRMWYLASRGKVDSDPLVYVIKSPASYLAMLASTVIIYLAR